jgi:hypothetical protein
VAANRLGEIRRALARTVSTGTGRPCYAYPPRQVETPAFFPAARTGKPEAMLGESSTLIQPLWFVVPPTDEELFDLVDDMIHGDRSLPAVIDATPDLSIGVDAAAGEWIEGIVEVGGEELWGVRFDIEVIY